ncbi:MAG: glycosyltransferase family 39 protein [Deltaproteobacteria bacterium]|nr:glycosyltransferase family 39 protein [Deltaproteobacteria bacterium]
MAIAAGWAAAVALVGPRADVPILDDWCYAISVEELLRGLPLRVSPWSSTFPPVHLWWGALFARVGGFSFTTLRLSTLALWLAGTLGAYGTLRALGVRTAVAFVGVVAFALHPVGFVLAFSFMTDVPFVALSWLALWALVVGLRREREPVMLAGLALAVVAFFVRPVAIVLPAGLFVGALALDRAALRFRAALYATATVAVMAVVSVALTRLFPWAGDGGVQYRVMRLAFVLLVAPAVYAEAALSMLAHVGLAVLPLLVAFGPPPRRGAWLGALGLIAAAVAVSPFAEASVSAVKFAHTATFEELGAARPLLQGAPPRDPARAAATLVATALGLAAAAILLARVAAALRPGGRLRRAEWACVGGFGLASFGLCFVLWFFYDRYYLPLVMAGAVLALGDTTAPVAPWRRGLAAAAFALVALADVTGTRDMLAYARAVGATAAELRAAGVPELALDAGYAENGWRLYAHPERLPAGKTPELDVPHVTARADGLPWVIANAPLPGYRVLRTVAVPTWWAYTDRLYVLRAE